MKQSIALGLATVFTLIESVAMLRIAYGARVYSAQPSGTPDVGRPDPQIHGRPPPVPFHVRDGSPAGEVRLPHHAHTDRPGRDFSAA